jgi:guanylate kinase
VTSDRGLLIIVSSPSGGGKTTIIRAAIGALAEHGVCGHFSVSHTTRPARPAERHGTDYYFVDRPSFEAMVAAGEFVEWAEYAGSLYGTSRREVEGRLAAGTDVFLDIEVQGANQVKSQVPDVVKVFVYPPSYEVLRERLTQRRQDDPEAIRRRLQWATRELLVAGEFEYAIINDRLDRAVAALVAVVLAEHHRSARLKPCLDRIRAAFHSGLDEDNP